MTNSSSAGRRILRLVRDRAISTQSALVDALREEGHDVVQTTISAGRTRLGAEGARPVRAASCTRPGADDADRLRAIASRSVATRRASSTPGPLVVLTTPSGYASALAQAIDEGGHPGIAGTIAATTRSSSRRARERRRAPQLGARQHLTRI
jgi:arginine repressor